MTLGGIVEYRKYTAAEIPQDMLEEASIRVDEKGPSTYKLSQRADGSVEKHSLSCSVSVVVTKCCSVTWRVIDVPAEARRRLARFDIMVQTWTDCGRLYFARIRVRAVQWQRYVLEKTLA